MKLRPAEVMEVQGIAHRAPSGGHGHSAMCCSKRSRSELEPEGDGGNETQRSLLRSLSKGVTGALSRHLYYGLSHLVIPDDMTPSSDLFRQETYIWCMYLHEAKHSHTAHQIKCKSLQDGFRMLLSCDKRIHSRLDGWLRGWGHWRCPSRGLGV